MAEPAPRPSSAAAPETEVETPEIPRAPLGPAARWAIGVLTVAEICVETMKAQNYHWNVSGMAFGPLHELFQEIYEDHFEAQDELAERVKALDAHAEGRLSAFLERSKVQECDGRVPAETMIANLAGDQETIAASTRPATPATPNATRAALRTR